jgi:hypothetical protein
MFIEKYQNFWDTLKRYNWLQIYQALDVYRKISIFWDTLKRYNWSQIYQALDVNRKISDLLGHPEKIQLVTDPP